MKYIANAFSLNMMLRLTATIVVKEIPLPEARREALDRKSVVGHPDTAAIFSTLLEAAVAANRETVTLITGDDLLVGQYRGPRLPEGAKTLPEGARIDWCLVTIS